MKSLFKKTLTASALGLALGLASVSASAAPQFTINPGAIPGNAFALAPFNATFVSGFSSELLTLAGNNASGSGWLQLTAYSNGANAVGALVSGLGGADYNLYANFQLAASLASGVAGAPGSVYNLTTLNFQLYADPGLNTTFTSASVAGNVGTNASVGGTLVDDILLAGGTLITGTAGFNALGGVFLNSIESFAICTGVGTATVGGVAVPGPGCASGVGNSYFAAPTPFYSLAFDEFNNTSQGIQRSTDGTLVAITSASGGVDFNNVPEPASLALIGLGMLGLGAMRRRSKV